MLNIKQLCSLKTIKIRTANSVAVKVMPINLFWTSFHYFSQEWPPVYIRKPESRSTATLVASPAEPIAIQWFTFSCFLFAPAVKMSSVRHKMIRSVNYEITLPFLQKHSDQDFHPL